MQKCLWIHAVKYHTCPHLDSGFKIWWCFLISMEWSFLEKQSRKISTFILKVLFYGTSLQRFVVNPLWWSFFEFRTFSLRFSCFFFVLFHVRIFDLGYLVLFSLYFLSIFTYIFYIVILYWIVLCFKLDSFHSYNNVLFKIEQIHTNTQNALMWGWKSKNWV